MKDDTSDERNTTRGDGPLWQELAEQLQEAWRRGDELLAGDLFYELETRSAGWLRSIAVRKLPEGASAEDFVSDVYVALWEIIVSGKPVLKVKGLLGTIMRRRIADEYRRRERGIEEPADDLFWEQYSDTTPSVEHDPEESAIDADTARRLNAILATLPAEELDVFLARGVDGLSTEQAAAKLGLTGDQVKKRLRSAKKRLEKAIKEGGL